MVRAILACAAFAALLSPVLAAQTKVCVFQEKPGHAAGATASDADALADALNSRTIQTQAAVGVSKKDEDAEAQKRGCPWIVTLWRQNLAADSPNYGGTLGGTQAPNYNAVELEGNKAGGGALLEFSLRKAGTRKPSAHGESEDTSPYPKIAEQIVKKLAKD